MISNLFSISILISVICTGVDLLMGKGMLLHFMQKPYLKLLEDKTRKLRTAESIEKDILRCEREFEDLVLGRKILDKEREKNSDLTEKRIEHLRDYMFQIKIARDTTKEGIRRIDMNLFVLKPMVGCSTCMASFWTLILILPILYVQIGDIEMALKGLWVIPVVMVMVAAFNSFVLNIYNLIRIKQNCNCGK